MALHAEITAGELSEMLSEIGAAALVEALAQMEADDLAEEPQDHQQATYAPKLSREMARLDWRLPARELDRWIRGCDPWPAAWTVLDGTPVQLFAPKPDEDDVDAEPGTVLVAGAKTELRVAAGAGSLCIGEVKPAGRPRMSATAWVAGRGVGAGQSFE